MSDKTTILACDVINQALPPQVVPLTDPEIFTDCAVCGKEVRLSDCEITQGLETTYKCKKCKSPVLIIGLPEVAAWPGRGYRMIDFIVRNPSELRFRGTALSRSPEALAPARDNQPP